jgi:F-type H+-transporting ATPase subunit b
MKRLGWMVLALGLVLAPVKWAAAQDTAAAKPEAAEPEPAGAHEEKEPAEIWKWANFILLAGGLGYLAYKHAPAFFAARSREIVQGMTDAKKLREEAEARAAEIDRRLAHLEADITRLRDESQAEIAAETERLAARRAAEIVKIEAHATQEIESAGKLARMELKRYAAQLSIELAERKVRARMTPETQNDLVGGFVTDLRNPSSGSQQN